MTDDFDTSQQLRILQLVMDEFNRENTTLYFVLFGSTCITLAGPNLEHDMTI